MFVEQNIARTVTRKAGRRSIGHPISFDYVTLSFWLRSFPAWAIWRNDGMAQKGRSALLPVLLVLHLYWNRCKSVVLDFLAVHLIDLGLVSLLKIRCETNISY